MTKSLKITLISIISVVVIVSGLLGFYLKALPEIVSSTRFANFIHTTLQKSYGVDFEVKNPVLKTDFSPVIVFSVDELHLTKNNENLFSISNFASSFSFAKIFQKKILINKVGAEDIFVNVNKLISAFPQTSEDKKETKNDWVVDVFNSLLYVKNIVIEYSADEMNLHLAGKDIEITETRNPKFVKFDFLVELSQNDEYFVFKLKDNDSVYIDNKKLYAKNCDFFINNSKVRINYVGSQDNTFELNLASDKIFIKDVVDLIETNLLIPNGKELLAMFSDIDGSFDFKINMNNQGLNGKMSLHKATFKYPMLNDFPVLINSGVVEIDKENIILKDFKGYYGKSAENKIDIAGTIADYMNTFDTKIEGYIKGTKEFTNDYLTPMLGYPIELIGETTAKVKVAMLNNKIDVAFIFRLVEGYDILVDGLSLTPTDYQRAFRIDLSMYDNIMELVNLNYYIAEGFEAGVVVEPILRIYGKFDMFKNMAIQNLGFEIPKPLPSEFLNVLLGQRIFRRGTISGNMQFIDDGTPKLVGGLAMDKVLIPSQRLSIREGRIKASDNSVNMNVNGRYKRSKYEFSGNVLNEIKLPIVVKNINLSIDNIDVEKLMASFAAQPAQSTDNVKESLASAKDDETIDIEAETTTAPTFYTNVIVIENCLLEIAKGVYKQINFGNVKANMTLDRDGIMKVESNRFDIADGISSAKIFIDLQNQIYKMRLGIKDVNSDVIATSLLNLPKEISGKARGFIDLETDKSLKLNGKIVFDIKNGFIAKVGLVEYALKFVSLFRNPLSMISPATVFDIANIPEGQFEKIDGRLMLKDNIIERMMIKSTAPQLGTFIVGKYNLESGDASLRIYTKFSDKKNGVAGFLRKISLNGLANSITFGGVNTSSYYEADLSMLPEIDADEKDCQVFLTKVEGDVVNNNFLSSLKRIK